MPTPVATDAGRGSSSASARAHAGIMKALNSMVSPIEIAMPRRSHRDAGRNSRSPRLVSGPRRGVFAPR